MLVASTRMYNVAPEATAAWRRLLERVGAASGIALEIVEHAPPATLGALWGRADLGCAFMCGWPLAQAGGRHTVIAAPVPVGEAGARYRSVFVVAARGFTSLEQTFGHRFAFNAETSHSGWNMPWADLAGRGGWYPEWVGPFGPHQRAAAAVASGQAEVAALDSLVWALIRRHDKALAGSLVVVAQTDDQPAPPLVGAPGLDAGIAAGLRRALVGLGADAPGRALLEAVCLERFVPASADDYRQTLLVQGAPCRVRVPAGGNTRASNPLAG